MINSLVRFYRVGDVFMMYRYNISHQIMIRRRYSLILIWLLDPELKYKIYEKVFPLFGNL